MEDPLPRKALAALPRIPSTTLGPLMSGNLQGQEVVSVVTSKLSWR